MIQYCPRCGKGLNGRATDEPCNRCGYGPDELNEEENGEQYDL